MPSSGPWLLLLGAILVEVCATTLLKRSNGMSHPAYAALALTAYLLAIWLFSVVMRWIPTGIVYALWSGLGIVLVSLVAWLFFGEAINAWGLVGMALIALETVIIQVSATHSPPADKAETRAETQPVKGPDQP
jgi:multidrug transporter EmrE-like cation transporter